MAHKGDILVVDDAPANLRLLGKMLSDHGYRARVAPNGQSALEAVEREAPDLILLDINMPEMNGYVVCEKLKDDKRHKDIPVIFVSALSEPLDKVKAFGSGGVDYIVKPFQLEEVLARVETHIKLFRMCHACVHPAGAPNFDKLREAIAEINDGVESMLARFQETPLDAEAQRNGLNVVRKKCKLLLEKLD